MINIIKNLIRDSIPKKFQVPIKYYINFIFFKNEIEMYLLKKLINRKSFAIDIGGNRGVYSFYLNKITQKLKVFEPNLGCYNILFEWSKNKNKIEIINKALSDKIGTSHLIVPVDKNGILHDASGKIINSNYETNNIKYEIQITTLDSFNFSKVDFIKIDVEGHELKVIEGATNTLTLFKPALLIEIEERHSNGSIKNMTEKLSKLNYEGFFYYKSKLLKIKYFNTNTYQSIENLNSKKFMYINNFFFLDKSKIKNEEYIDFFKQFNK